jgi:hypothetical protein
MKLPGFKKKQPQIEYFLSLNIAAHKTAAILFQKNKNAKIKITLIIKFLNYSDNVLLINI